MATYGLTATGLLAKPVAQIVTDLNTAVLSGISPTLNLSATSALGQLIGVVANAVAECWNLLQGVYSAFDPNASAGDQLASLSLVTGTVKRAATNSVAKAVTVNLNAGVTLPAGSLASVANNPAAVFASVAPVTNSGGAPANVSVDFKAVGAGATIALTGTLNVIAAAVAGWNSVTNPTDAVVGLPLETDPQLRLRRAQELSTAGASTADAIRSGVLGTLGQAVGGDVVSCSVLWNDTDAVDGNGLTPHSFEVIALGAVGGSTNDTALAQQILTSKAAGDRAVGQSSLSVNDSQGNGHIIGFTRPTTLPVYVAITVKTTAAFPADGVAQIQAAIVAWAQLNLIGGQAVVIEKIKSLAFIVVGVSDVPAAAIGFAPAPVGTVNLAVGVRQIATISTGAIVVTVT